MKKCVFIIEDKLKDMKSFFIFLHELLLNAEIESPGEMLERTDVKIFFLHICWDIDTDACERNKHCFDEIRKTVESTVRRVTSGPAFEMEYCPIQLKSDNYVEDAIEDCGKAILKQIEKLLSEELGKKIEMREDNEPFYAVLMDVVLNDSSDKDLQWLTDEHDIPTSWLYRRLTKDRCIVFSEYPPALLLENWSRIAGMEGDDEEIIQRVHLTRSRAVYIPLKKRLYQILNLKYDR